MKKEKKKKEEKDERKAQRIGIQKPMKGKGFKKYIKEKKKGRPSRPKSVSQKEARGNWAGILKNARARGSLECTTLPKLDPNG